MVPYFSQILYNHIFVLYYHSLIKHSSYPCAKDNLFQYPIPYSQTLLQAAVDKAIWTNSPPKPSPTSTVAGLGALLPAGHGASPIWVTASSRSRPAGASHRAQFSERRIWSLPCQKEPDLSSRLLDGRCKEYLVLLLFQQVSIICMETVYYLIRKSEHLIVHPGANMSTKAEANIHLQNYFRFFKSSHPLFSFSNNYSLSAVAHLSCSNESTQLLLQSSILHFSAFTSLLSKSELSFSSYIAAV